MESMQTQSASGKGGSSLAIIIIILIVALGGAYFWYSRTASAPAPKADLKTKPSVSTASLQGDLDTAGNVDITGDMKGLDQVYK